MKARELAGVGYIFVKRHIKSQAYFPYILRNENKYCTYIWREKNQLLQPSKKSIKQVWQRTSAFFSRSLVWNKQNIAYLPFRHFAHYGHFSDTSGGSSYLLSQLYSQKLLVTYYLDKISSPGHKSALGNLVTHAQSACVHLHPSWEKS
jgi:hypothetical protein